jgi:general secretion pathway protein J
MRNPYKGFTLLEILIALFIFTIISVIMVTALHTVLSSQSATEKKANRLTELQTTLILMARDLEQTVNRPIISSKNTLDSFLGTPYSLTFTHAGLVNPLGELQRSTLQRTQYFLDKQALIRRTWPVLDQTAKTQPNERIILKNTESIRFEYLDNKGRFHNSWPLPDDKESILPKAVRVSLTIAQWGNLTQLYLIPAQTPPKSAPTPPTTIKETTPHASA